MHVSGRLDEEHRVPEGGAAAGVSVLRQPDMNTVNTVEKGMARKRGRTAAAVAPMMSEPMTGRGAAWHAVPAMTGSGGMAPPR